MSLVIGETNVSTIGIESRWFDFHDTEGSVDTSAAFSLSYICDVLAPQSYGVGAIVVMDNLEVDHAHSVKRAIEAVGWVAGLLPLTHQTYLPLSCVGQKLQAVLRWPKKAASYLRNPGPGK